MNDFAVASQSIGAGLFLLLAVLLLPNWHRRLLSTLLVVAATISAVWLGTLAFYANNGNIPLVVPQVMEVVRDAAWLVFLVAIIAKNLATARTGALGTFILIPTAVICGVLIGLLVMGGKDYESLSSTGGSIPLLLLGHLLLAILGLVLIEHLYRNTKADRRWAIKYLCLGIGGLFAYDFYLYSNAVLFKAINASIWNARGVINGLAVPLIAIAAARNRHWKLDLFVSRQVVFHSTAILAIGTYLLFMAGAGYYIRMYGGTWGQSLQVVFFAGALIVLLILIFSGQARSQLKVFLAKHFYRNKYEYREEWLKFTGTLSQDIDSKHVRENIVKAIAGIMESPRAALWERGESGFFALVEDWNMNVSEDVTEPSDSSLIQFLQNSEWVINLNEFRVRPERYNHLIFPTWLSALKDAWLIVPLMLGEELVGFVVLGRSRANISYNWEDNDLLKTVGRQTAGYLALLEATNALSRARQFEAFNRISAFVVHDLKNIVAQLSLVVANANRHMGNPDFMKDAVATVENAVEKMNQMLQQLRKGESTDTRTEQVDLQAVLQEVVANRSVRRPVPVLELEESGLRVVATRNSLSSVTEHLVQNAQEATPEHGLVSIRLSRNGDNALVEIEDTGCGMNAEFIRERLFAPFETTKGNAGMGIGVFESREVVRALGGEIRVKSSPGVGTIFTILLPLADAQQDQSFVCNDVRSVRVTK